VDEQQRNERITDRIIESIDRAEFVICDLTHARPNVYFEAGYAHGRGKVPIYIAREGTEIHFDIKDYPVIFFGSVRELKKELNERLKGVAKRAHALSADRPVV
jgi:nucleoside 2-deoxyribosyltransferase